MKAPRIISLFSILIIVMVTVTYNSCKKDKEEEPAPLPQNDTLISASANIGPGGGQIELPDGSKLIIPANALSSNTMITLSKVKGAPIIGEADYEFIKLEPEGLIYNSPVTLEIPISNMAKLDTSVFSVYTVHNDQYEETISTINTQKQQVQITINHHSWLSLFYTQKLYIVLNIPGEYLRKGDLIYIMETVYPFTDVFTWFPGHTGLYLGTTDPQSNANNGQIIVESVPPNGVGTDESFNKFREDSEHLYMGARRYNGTTTDQDRTEIATFGIEKIGACYWPIGYLTAFQCLSCVDLTENAYEFAGLNIVPNISEIPFNLPYTQYTLTMPVDEVDVKSGEKISIPVFGVVWDKQDNSYTKSSQLFSANCYNIPSGATFQNNKFEWEPPASAIGNSYTVNFSVTSQIGNTTYKQSQSLKMNVTQGGGTELPTVTTNSVTNITETTATCGGNISDQGSSTVTSRGVCWSTSSNPTIADDYTTDGSGTGSFTSNITGLTANTPYYVRAFATNNAGTAYGSQRTFTTQGSGGGGCDGVTSVPYQGQTYNTVEIGDQCWFKENLNIGTMINGSQEQTNNSQIEKYCYGNSISNCETNGGLYQWDEMMQYVTSQGAQGICPDGWHIPTDDEWKILEGTVDSQYGVGNSVWNQTDFRGYDAGKNLKDETNWYDGANLFDFSAFHTGNRHYSLKNFHNLDDSGLYWCSDDTGSSEAYYRLMHNGNDGVYRTTTDKGMGFAVRCIKNN